MMTTTMMRMTLTAHLTVERKKRAVKETVGIPTGLMKRMMMVSTLPIFESGLIFN